MYKKLLSRVSCLSLVFSIFLACNHADAVEPEIIGAEKFTVQVKKALLLLKEKDFDAYTIVANYIGRIESGPRSGMWAYHTPPTYEMSPSVASDSVTWVAATIAHDSYHSKLYHEYKNAHPGNVPDAVWTGTAIEQLCMKHQLVVMEHIGASQREIDYAKTQMDGHYVRDGETWLGYWFNRTW